MRHDYPHSQLCQSVIYATCNTITLSQPSVRPGEAQSEQEAYTPVLDSADKEQVHRLTRQRRVALPSCTVLYCDSYDVSERRQVSLL